MKTTAAGVCRRSNTKYLASLAVLIFARAVFSATVTDLNAFNDQREEDPGLLVNGVVKEIGASCLSGWTRFKSYCYLVSSSIKTWHQAQAYCKGQAPPAELVKINSADENKFVLSLVNQRAPSLRQVWIGLKWGSSANRFLWYDHSVPVYTNWAPNEPNENAREPCGHMWTDPSRSSVVRKAGDWNDFPCGVDPNLPNGLVCKRSVS